MPTESKLHDLLTSRKFYALVLALLVNLFGVLYHGVTVELAVLASVGALSVYMASTAVESSGQAQADAVVKSASIVASVSPVAPHPPRG